MSRAFASLSRRVLLLALVATLSLAVAKEADDTKPKVESIGCAREDNCVSCTRRAECGWCESENACLPGTVELPSITWKSGKDQAKQSECLVNPALWHFDQGSCSATARLNTLKGPLVPDQLDSVSNILDIVPELKNETDAAAAKQQPAATNATASDSSKSGNQTERKANCSSHDTVCLAKFQNESLALTERELATKLEQLDDLRKQYLEQRRTFHMLNLYQANNMTANQTLNATLVSEATTLANKEEAERLAEEARKLRKEAIKLHPELAKQKNGTKSTDSKDSSSSSSASKFLQLEDSVRPSSSKVMHRLRNPKHARRN